jgi:hypothetical protein
MACLAYFDACGGLQGLYWILWLVCFVADQKVWQRTHIIDND